MFVVEYWPKEETHWKANVRMEGPESGTIRLSFQYGLSHTEPPEREVLPRMQEVLRRNPIPWVTTAPGAWTLDLTGLRNELATYSGLDWLSGTVSLQPEVTVEASHHGGFGSYLPRVQFYLHPGIADASTSARVFVVHGRDEAAREKVARLLERLGLNPVILHEQPNKSRTIIEKFEQYADVCFAVVLLTADDIGGLAGSAFETLAPRARQNVILELGYFLGKLGREKVCVLWGEGVETPSDYDGVLFVKLDTDDAWRTKLARELRGAGLPADLNRL